jgi:imidazolonepropionase-like amidohydrolase
MVQLGMTPPQAIRTATQNSADLIGRSKDVGTIEVGKYADIIAVTGDPLHDVSTLQNVGFVMKGGTVYKDKIAGTVVAE